MSLCLSSKLEDQGFKLSTLVRSLLKVFNFSCLIFFKFNIQVEFQYFLGTLNILLSPKQLHVLMELVEDISRIQNTGNLFEELTLPVYR